MQLWGIFWSDFGGVIFRCPLGQMTVRPPRAVGLCSERLGFWRVHKLLGWRFIWRRLSVHEC